METGEFYLDIGDSQVLLVLERMKVYSRYRVRYQDGTVSSRGIDDVAGLLYLGSNYKEALEANPQLEYEFKLCKLTELD